MVRRMMLAPLVAGLIGLLAGPATASEPIRGGMWVEVVTFSGGDNDGIPEPGERLEVTISVRNGGPDAATDLTGTLTSTSDAVRVLQDTSPWPDLAVEEAGENTRAFVIEIAEGAARQETTCEPMRPDEPVSIEPGYSDPGASEEELVVEGQAEPIETSEDGGGADGSAGSEPTVVEPDQGTGEEPEPVKEEPPVEEPPADEPAPDEEPAPDVAADAPVHVALTLSLAGQDLYADNGIVCAMLETGTGGMEPAAGEDDRAFEAMPISAPADGNPAGRAPAIISASVLLGAMAALLAWQKLRGSAAA